jgi:uncharacterized protein YvpB
MQKEEVNRDQKAILHSDVEKCYHGEDTHKMPQHIIMFLQMYTVYRKRIKSQLITYIHKTRDWSKDLIDVIMNVLKKKPIATKYSNHHTNSLTPHAAKMAVRILSGIFRKH